MAPLASEDPTFDTIATIAGWGLIASASTAVGTQVLMKVTVPVLDTGYCEEVFHKNLAGQICTDGAANKGACMVIILLLHVLHLKYVPICYQFFLSGLKKGFVFLEKQNSLIIELIILPYVS